MIDNSHGVIEAGSGSNVYIGTGTILRSGQLEAVLANPLNVQFAGTVTAEGNVTLDGGTTGLDLEGDIETVDALTVLGSVATAGQLTLKGLITGTPYATAPGGTLVRSGSDGFIFLDGATFKGGELAAAGTAAIGLTTATLDGSSGPGSIALAGTLDAATGTLTIIGGLLPAAPGSEIEVTGGTIIVGSAADDAATLGAGSNDPTTRGTLLLDTFATSTVRGYDAASSLDNDWLIVGSGILGQGKLAITNEAGGTIEATGANVLAIDGGAKLLTNHGLLLAAPGGRLTLDGNVNNAGGEVLANAGSISLGANRAMTLAGGLLATSGGGTIRVGNGSTLDGTAAAVTLASGAQIVLGYAQTVTGSIVNRTALVLGTSVTGTTPSVLTIAGTATLGGGGTLTLMDPSGAQNANTQIVAGLAGSVLDNVDNSILGTGRLGNGSTFVVNEAAGTIAAEGGTLYLAPGGANAGLLGAIGGTLDVSGGIANAGGTIAAHDDGAHHSGVVTLDSVSIAGGTLDGDATDTASMFSVSGSSTLDGRSSNTVALTATAHVQVGARDTLLLEGSIVDHGTIALSASSSVPASVARLSVFGHTTLSGGGSVSLTDGAGKGGATQVITGSTTADILDNAGVTITGAGLLGAYMLDVINEAAGTISATAGALSVQTRSGALVNAGLLTSVSTGTLDLRPNVTNTGTIGAAGGITLLDNDTVTGGTFSGSAGGQVLGTYGTIDATVSAVTLTAGAMVGVSVKVPGNATLLTLEGDFVNGGAFFAEGSSAKGLPGTAALVISGNARLSGGGKVLLIDDSAPGAAGAAQFIGNTGSVPNTYASNTLDNIDNTISGTGTFGNVSLAITNEAAGLISATGGTLLLNTFSSNSGASHGSLANRGIVQASGGTLDLSAMVDNAGGLIRALNDGAGHSGLVILDRAVIQGGTLAADATDPASFVTALAGTLDGTGSAVTLGAGTPLHVAPRGSLTLKGSIVNLGTVLVQADGVKGASAAVQVAGTVHLGGGGQVALSDFSAVADSIYGASGADLLDNVNDAITGFGRLGFGALSLTNEAAGIIAAEGGILYVAPGGTGSTWTNLGLMEGLGGTLDLQGVVANASGTIAARSDGAHHSGLVVLDGVTVQGGTLDGDAADAASVIGAGGTANVLDGSLAAVRLAAAAQLQLGPNNTLTLKGAIVDQGIIALSANSANFYNQAVLQVSGHATLSGGGAVVLTDTSGTGGTHTQTITGLVATDTLENAGVRIVGAGMLGNSFSFINDPGGSVSANAGTLVVQNTVSVTNTGLLTSLGTGTLDLKASVANTGGTIASAGGITLLDGDTVTGGTFSGSAGGMVLGYGATIDGTAATVTITTGGIVGVVSTVPNSYVKQLTLKGTIDNQGTLLVQGDDEGPYVNKSELLISGAVKLTGGGQVALTGLTAKDTGGSTLVIGLTGADTLENVDNTIAGFGSLGPAALSIVDDAAGLIRAQGGTLDVQGAVRGTGTLAVADHATLQLDGTIGTGLTIDFQPGGGHESVVLGKPLGMLGAIEDFAATDTISFAGNYRAVGRTFSNGVLTVTGDGAVVATLDFLGPYNALNTSVVDSGGQVTITTSVACYVAGTSILTPHGERPVEALAIGDLLVTASGIARPVKWIGRRSYAGRFLKANANVQPIRFRAGSLGAGVPRRDLLVSPEHAMLIDGVLVPARELVNHSTIVPDRLATCVEYIHVELDHHDVIWAEGATSETYLDDDSRAMFHNASDYAARYGDAPAPRGFCARRVTHGYALQAIRDRLARQPPIAKGPARCSTGAAID